MKLEPSPGVRVLNASAQQTGTVDRKPAVTGELPQGRTLSYDVAQSAGAG
jgi:hypothetical protein